MAAGALAGALALACALPIYAIKAIFGTISESGAFTSKWN